LEDFFYYFFLLKLRSLLIFPVPKGQRIACFSPLSSKFLEPGYVQEPIPHLPSVFSSLTKKPQLFQPLHTWCSPALCPSSLFFLGCLKPDLTRTEFPCRVTESRRRRDGSHAETHPAHTLSLSSPGDTGTCPSPGRRSSGRGRRSAVGSLPRTIREDRLQGGGRRKAFC